MSFSITLEVTEEGDVSLLDATTNVPPGHYHINGHVVEEHGGYHSLAVSGPTGVVSASVHK